ncbi:MAG: DUF418 domain-containing protein [Kurthia sp.]|nr:DUF418 domain-containing protein [Candidatus Kurthia equi]
MRLGATARTQRIETLDVLRGVSLLGIILVNILAFNYPINYIRLPEFLTTPGDLASEKLLTIFVQGSFYPLFAWLFGYGLQMQRTKAISLQQGFWKFGSKRLAILAVIGLLHAFFIWYGDILFTYAIFGFVLLFFLRLKPIVQTTIGLFLFGLYHFYYVVTYWLYSRNPNYEDGAYYSDITNVKSSVEAYRDGNWLDAFSQRMSDLSIQLSGAMWLQAAFTILPFMILGAAASQWRLIERAKQLKAFWVVLAILGLIIGLYLKIQIYENDMKYFGYAIGALVGAPILAVGYASLLVVLSMIPGGLKILKPFCLTGRMSLTTYLMQSVIQSLLFYGFGLGLYGKLPIETLILIAVTIYILQIVFAWIWLSFFKQGPVEMLWKRITYGKNTENRGN